MPQNVELLDNFVNRINIIIKAIANPTSISSSLFMDITYNSITSLTTTNKIIYGIQLSISLETRMPITIMPVWDYDGKPGLRAECAHECAFSLMFWIDRFLAMLYLLILSLLLIT
jgi:hypothetical protein